VSDAAEAKAELPVVPLFRWAGGKRRLVPQLLKLLPKDLSERTYNEPFAGSAALALHVRSTRPHTAAAYISDANWYVYNALYCAANHILLVEPYLRDQERFYDRDPRGTFAENVRLMQHGSADRWDRAGAFMCVQQMSFNGLWRVNSSGRYNVPFGKRSGVNLPSYEHLFAAREALRNCIIEHLDAFPALRMGHVMTTKRKTFWYIDPPYVAAAGEHTRYMAADFKAIEHEQLVSEINELVTYTDAKVMISAADTLESMDIYKRLIGFSHFRRAVHRSISAKPRSRGAVSELVFTNYADFDA